MPPSGCLLHRYPSTKNRENRSFTPYLSTKNWGNRSFTPYLSTKNRENRSFTPYPSTKNWGNRSSTPYPSTKNWGNRSFTSYLSTKNRENQSSTPYLSTKNRLAGHLSLVLSNGAKVSEPCVLAFEGKLGGDLRKNKSTLKWTSGTRPLIKSNHNTIKNRLNIH